MKSRASVGGGMKERATPASFLERRQRPSSSDAGSVVLISIQSTSHVHWMYIAKTIRYRRSPNHKLCRLGISGCVSDPIGTL
jgi:hypothetical protein